MAQTKSSDIPRTGRLPRNYATVLNAIRAAGPGVHLTAYDVFARVRAASPAIGFATVHRALGRLVDEALVAKIDVPGVAASLFESPAAPHAHFHCTRCGSIRDIPFTVPPKQVAALAAGLHVHIDAAATTFAGHCDGCARA